MRTALEAYTVMGLPSTCRLEEIKTKYRELVKLHHPDTNTGNSSPKKMEDINRAYQILVKDGGHGMQQREKSSSPFPGGPATSSTPRHHGGPNVVYEEAAPEMVDILELATPLGT